MKGLVVNILVAMAVTGSVSSLVIWIGNYQYRQAAFVQMGFKNLKPIITYALPAALAAGLIATILPWWAAPLMIWFITFIGLAMKATTK